MKSVVSLVMFAALTSVLGAAGDGTKVVDNDLKQIGLAYYNYVEKNNKAPQKLEDLEPYLIPDSKTRRYVNHLKDKRIELFYGLTPKEMKDGAVKTILGYAKDTPTKGGLVLFGDTSVKMLTAEEFKKAPKAKK